MLPLSTTKTKQKNQANFPMYKIKSVFFLAALLLLSGCFFEDPAQSQAKQTISEQKIDKQDPNWKTKLTLPQKLDFKEGSQYFWLLETRLGNLKIKLDHENAPMHVSSTIYLTMLGFYDDLTFHRIINGFMAQGGDPLGNGQGFPGYRYGGEFEGTASHDKAGMLSMANAGPNTDGSQFFITFKNVAFLDGRHTVFGEVIEGMDTLEKIEQLGTRGGKPKEALSITKASIIVE